MNEEKFTGKADLYTKNRTGYPTELVDYLYSEAGFTPTSKIADIGAGTGKLSELLLLRGSSVVCVEPNPDMIDVAKQELSRFEKCSFIEAPAENTCIEENSVDFITVAQAIHWFDHEKFKNECKRILRKNGKIVIIWYERDLSAEQIIANENVRERFFLNYKPVSEKMEDSINFFKDDFCDIKEFNEVQIVDEDGFIGSNLSSSYAPKASDEKYEEFKTELKKVFDKYSKDGKFAMPYIIRCYIVKCD